MSGTPGALETEAPGAVAAVLTAEIEISAEEPTQGRPVLRGASAVGAGTCLHRK